MAPHASLASWYRPAMKLYGFWRSTATWRVRIALAWKGLEHAYQPVNLTAGAGEQHSEAYAALNPMRQVPLLELASQDGRLVRIAQSMAILEYLEERFPDPPLLPVDPLLRAQARQLSEMVNAGIQPLQNTGVQSHLREVGVDTRAWVQHWVGRGLSALETATAATAGRYCVGDAVSFADATLIPEMYFARRFHLSMDAYPTLTRIEAECAALPAFQRAHAEQQPDAPAR